MHSPMFTSALFTPAKCELFFFLFIPAICLRVFFFLIFFYHMPLLNSILCTRFPGWMEYQIEAVQYRAMFLNFFFIITPLRYLLDIFSLSHSYEILIPQIHYVSVHVPWPFRGSQTFNIWELFAPLRASCSSTCGVIILVESTWLGD